MQTFPKERLTDAQTQQYPREQWRHKAEFQFHSFHYTARPFWKVSREVWSVFVFSFNFFTLFNGSDKKNLIGFLLNVLFNIASL